jgi:hypothetical protein
LNGIGGSPIRSIPYILAPVRVALSDLGLCTHICAPSCFLHPGLRT